MKNEMKASRWLHRVVAFAFAVACAAGVWAGVPYVASDGVDDWLETGFVATPQSKVVVELAMLDDVPASAQWLFGSHNQTSGANFCVHVSNGKKYTCWTGAGQGDAAYTVSDITANKDTVTICMDRLHGKVSVAGSAGSHEFAAKAGSLDSAYSLAIFAAHKSSATTAASFAKMKLYSFACYENDVPVHHFVPYRSSDGDTVGMVDTITGTVLVNRGSGKLTYGEDAENPGDDPCLRSFGAQWINTGYIIKPNSRVELDMAWNVLENNMAAGSQVENNYYFLFFLNGAMSWGVRGTDFAHKDNYANFSTAVVGSRTLVALDRMTPAAELTLQDGTHNSLPLSAQDNSQNTGCGMALFGVAKSDTTAERLSKIDVYSCRIYEYEGGNQVLKHEYLPHLDGEAACLRDTQTGANYYNLGTGDFAYRIGRPSLRPDAVTVLRNIDVEGWRDDAAPTIGTSVGFAPGETVDAHVACDTFTDAGGRSVSLTGWELSTNTVDYTWAVWRTGSTTNCTFAHPGSAVQLKWQWSVTEVSADIRELAANGTGGDTLVLTGRLEDFEGENCTFRILTGATAEELTNEWPGLEGLVRTERGDFSFTLHEPNVAAARYLKPGTTVYVAIEATANGSTLRTAPIPVALKSAAVFGSVTATAVQRTLTVSGTMADIGMHGTDAPKVSLWGGISNDSQTFTKVAEADLTSLAFSFDWNVEAFDATYYWQVRTENTAAGGTKSATAPTAVKSSVCIDAATYTWKTSVATGRWENAASWASDRQDCVGYPCSSAATAKFAVATTARVEVARSLSVDTFDISAKKLNVKFVAMDGPVSVTAAKFPNIGADTSSVRHDSSLVFDGVSLELLADINGGICIGSGSSLVFSGGAEICTPGQTIPFTLRYRDASDFSGVSSFARGLYDSGDVQSAAQKVHEYWFGGDALVRIGRPTTATVVYIGQYSGGGGGAIELYGHGALTVKTQFRGSNTAGNTIPSRVNFLVPEEGYVNAPLVGLSNVDLLGGDESQFPNITSKIHLSVPKGAPLYKASGKREIPLISWPAGIVTNRVVLDACPRSRSKSYLYYTYDGNGKATGVSLHYNGRPGFVLSVQ